MASSITWANNIGSPLSFVKGGLEATLIEVVEHFVIADIKVPDSILEGNLACIHVLGHLELE